MMESPDGFLLVPELYSVQREDVTAEEVREKILYYALFSRAQQNLISISIFLDPTWLSEEGGGREASIHVGAVALCNWKVTNTLNAS